MKDTGQILADILVGGELKIHLIGVAGSGMSGIAGLLLAIFGLCAVAEAQQTLTLEIKDFATVPITGVPLGKATNEMLLSRVKLLPLQSQLETRRVDVPFEHARVDLDVFEADLKILDQPHDGAVPGAAVRCWP